MLCMLVHRELNEITGFSFTSLLNLEARGVESAKIVILPFADHNEKLYGNAIVASSKLTKENPAPVKAFFAAFAKGSKDAMANPAIAIESLKPRDVLINAPLETRRLPQQPDGRRHHGHL